MTILIDNNDCIYGNRSYPISQVIRKQVIFSLNQRLANDLDACYPSLINIPNDVRLDNNGFIYLSLPHALIQRISTHVCHASGSLELYKDLYDPLLGSDRIFEKNYRRSLLFATKSYLLVELLASKKIVEAIRGIDSTGNIRLGYVDIWQDGLNPVMHSKESETRLFHRDGAISSLDGKTVKRLLKLFILLHDTYPCHGPFQYVMGSNISSVRRDEKLVEQISRIPGRYSISSVLSYYGSSNLFSFTGSLGSAVLCDTGNGLHRGLMQKKGFLRTLIAAYYEIL